MRKSHLGKGSQVMSKIITLDINMKITELENNKTYKYFGIDEVNSISQIIDEEKIRKEIKKKIRVILRRELNAKNKVMHIGNVT